MAKTLGKYEIVKTIGAGATCKAKLGLDTETGKYVAIKIINQNLDESTKKAVMNEVQAL